MEDRPTLAGSRVARLSGHRAQTPGCWNPRPHVHKQRKHHPRRSQNSCSKTWMLDLLAGIVARRAAALRRLHRLTVDGCRRRLFAASRLCPCLITQHIQQTLQGARITPCVERVLNLSSPHIRLGMISLVDCASLMVASIPVVSCPDTGSMRAGSGPRLPTVCGFPAGAVVWWSRTLRHWQGR